MRANYFYSAFFMIAVLSMLLMSGHYLFSDDTGILKTKDISAATWYLITFRIHICGGILAMFIGALQLIKPFRKRSVKLHRLLGYVYVIAICFSSIAGLVIAQFAMGGISTQIGFSILAICWFYTTYRATHAVIHGDIKKHKVWILRSYALSFSAITQRTLLLVPLLTSIDFMMIYRLSAWLPWMLNLLFVEWIRRKQKKVQTKLSTVL